MRHYEKIINKVLHVPSSTIKEEAEDDHEADFNEMMEDFAYEMADKEDDRDDD